jgi:hypothetical protein
VLGAQDGLLIGEEFLERVDGRLGCPRKATHDGEAMTGAESAWVFWREMVSLVPEDVL